MFEANFMGKAGMYWFVGVVEDRMDPLKLGRYRVRCIGFHTNDKTKLPTDTLPWATTMLPVTSASMSGVSQTPALVEGSWVVGFFMDGAECQRPCVMGSLPGIPIEVGNFQDGFTDPRDVNKTSVAPGLPSVAYGSSGALVSNPDTGRFPKRLDEPDLSRAARNDAGMQSPQLASKQAARGAGQVDVPMATGGTFSEPVPSTSASYPYNKVTESESGHLIEMDDTRSAERINIQHRAGSFVEMHANGDVVHKSVKDRYDMTLVGAFEHAKTKAITVDNSFDIFVNVGESSHHLNLKIGAGGNINITLAGGNINITTTGSVDQTITGDVTQTINGIVTSTADSFNLTGEVNITGDVNVTGTTTSSVDVIGGGISLKTHVHGGVESGGDTSGPPE